MGLRDRRVKRLDGLKGLDGLSQSVVQSVSPTERQAVWTEPFVQKRHSVQILRSNVGNTLWCV